MVNLKRIILFFLIINLALISLIFRPDNKTAMAEAKEIYSKCSNLLYRENCYADEFHSLTKSRNLDFSSQTLSALQDIDPKNSLGCHFIAHRISVAEAEKDLSKWQDVIKKVRPSACSGGFIHGVVEARFHNDSSFKINAESVDLICSKILNDKSFGMQSCNHIMGHLLMVENGGIIDRSVKSCESLSQEAQYECLSGVFMENLTREGLVQHGLAKHISWNPEETLKIEKLCKEYKGPAGRACWREISYMYAAINNYSPEGIFTSCQRAPDEESRTGCFMYGIGNAVNFPQFRQENLTSACSVYAKGDPNLTLCNFQIIGSLISSSEKNVESALSICKGMEGESQLICYSHLIEVMKMDGVSKEIIERTCSNLPLTFPGGKCI